jgi:hypothetical protein
MLSHFLYFRSMWLEMGVTDFLSVLLISFEKNTMQWQAYLRKWNVYVYSAINIRFTIKIIVKEMSTKVYWVLASILKKRAVKAARYLGCM